MVDVLSMSLSVVGNQEPARAALVLRLMHPIAVISGRESTAAKVAQSGRTSTMLSRATAATRSPHKGSTLRVMVKLPFFYGKGTCHAG